MVYSFLYVNTLYNRLTLSTEVFDASIVVGDSFDNLTQFNFNRFPTLGVSYDQLDKLGFYKDLNLTPDPSNHYDLFIQEISQITLELYKELPEISVSFYQFSRKQNFPSVQKWVNLNTIFKKNLRQSIQEQFNQTFHQTDAKTLVQLLILLYKKYRNIEPILSFNIKNKYNFTMQDGALIQLDENGEEIVKSQISNNPLE